MGFRAMSGGFTAGASVSFQANVNAWVGPIPITGYLRRGHRPAAGLQGRHCLHRPGGRHLRTWTDEALKADSVNDYLTTLRIQGYIDAFGGLGFDYSVLALKIGLYGRLTGDTTNTFLSRTYLEDEDNSSCNGQAVGVTGEVGIKFFAKFLFVSYETVIASGSFTYTRPSMTSYIENYWNGPAPAAPACRWARPPCSAGPTWRPTPTAPPGWSEPGTI